MGRIAGTWARDASPIAPDIADRFDAALRRFSATGCRVVSGRSLVLGSAHFSGGSPSPFVEEELAVVLDGRLDDTEALAGRLGATGRATSPEALVLAAYRRWGRDFAEHLDGDFAIAIVDRGTRTLVLARDFAGVRPLHVAERGPLVVFGSEVKLLRMVPGVGREPNRDLLAEVLMGGTPRASVRDTFFADVGSVAPGTAVEFTATTHRVRRFFRLDVDSRFEGSETDALHRFDQRFRTAVRRRIVGDPSVGLLLSGGLDSSCILVVGLDERARDPRLSAVLPTTMEFPPGSPGDERGYLDVLESAFPIQVRRVPVRMVSSIDEIERVGWVGEAPLSAASVPSRLEAFEGFRGSGATSYLTGYWGDQAMASREYLVDLARRFRVREVTARLRDVERWITPGSPNAYRHGFVEDMVRWNLPKAAVVGARVLRARTRGPFGPAEWFSSDLRARAVRPTTGRVAGGWAHGSIHARALRASLESPYTALRLEFDNKVGASAGLDAAYPFLDRDLLSFLAAVPGEIVALDRVPRGLQREAIKGLLPDVIRLRRTKGDGTSTLNRELSAMLPDVVERIVDRGSASVQLDLIDREAFMKASRGFRAGLERNDSALLAGSLLSALALGAWANVYFGGDGKPRPLGE